MFGQRLNHRTHEGGDVPLPCLLCLAASKASPTPLIDPVTALALAADETLCGKADPKVAEDIVSRLLVLTSAEAREILDAVPPAVRDGCDRTGGCEFYGMVMTFLTARPLVCEAPLRQRRPAKVHHKVTVGT